MEQETKEKIANLAYPIAIAATFGALEYFGIGSSLREFEADKLAIKADYYEALNPMYWGECVGALWKPVGLEAMASLILGGLAGSCIAEPIKKLINKQK